MLSCHKLCFIRNVNLLDNTATTVVAIYTLTGQTGVNLLLSSWFKDRRVSCKKNFIPAIPKVLTGNWSNVE